MYFEIWGLLVFRSVLIMLVDRTGGIIMRRDRKKKADLSEENYALLEDTIRELCAQGRLLEEKKAMQHG